MRLFMGTVKKLGDAQEIEFTIPEFAEDPILYATPMQRNTRLPQPKDEVIIFQPDERFEIFLYMLTPEFTLSSDEQEFRKISLQLDNPEYDEEGKAKDKKHGLIELSKDKDSKYKATIQISDDIYMVFDEKENCVEVRMSGENEENIIRFDKKKNVFEIKLDEEHLIKLDKKSETFEAKLGATSSIEMKKNSYIKAILASASFDMTPVATVINNHFKVLV